MEWHAVGDDRGLIHGKTRLASDFYLEVTLRNRDGNFETRWLLPQCLWNRNSSAIVMEPCLPFQNKLKKPMSTKICAGNIWVTSMCVAALLSASKQHTRSAAGLGHAVRPLSHEGFRWALTKSFCWRCLETSSSHLLWKLIILLPKYIQLHSWYLTFIREVCVHAHAHYRSRLHNIWLLVCLQSRHCH